MPALEITTKIGCKNLCLYCPQDKLVKAYKGELLMTFEDFKRILENVHKNVRIDFSGFSEAFLNREASLMMKYSIDNGYKTTLYTTLVGFSNNDLSVLDGGGFDDVVFHQFNSKNFNKEEFDSQRKLFEDNVQKVDRVAIVDQIPGLDSPNTWKISRAGNAWDVKVQYGVFGCYLCSKLFHNNVVLPNGDVYICCMDYSLKHKIGNLFETNFDNLDRQQIIEFSNQEDSDIICRKCEYFKKYEV